MAGLERTRHADDLGILYRTRSQAEAALNELRPLLADLALELADAKTGCRASHRMARFRVNHLTRPACRSP
jgi:hypothetical protein